MHDWCSGCGRITKGRVLAGVWSSVQCCEAFSKQSVNHLSSATVEMLILDPKHGLSMGPPFQCTAVMLFNCKHNNNLFWKTKPFASVHSYLLQFARCWWHFCCHAVVVKTGLQAHTMGRPGAAHVPAGWPGPVSSYSAIVNILGDGGEVSLTVILRGYLYRKYQLEGDEVTNQSSTFSSQYVKWRFALPPKTGDNKFSVIFLAVVTVRVD